MIRLSLALTLALAACGSKAPPPTTTPPADPAPVAQKVLVNVDEEGTAILGFDSVAYHTDNKVTPGSGD
ncbi:MAG: hypothetical protein AB7T06_32340, partial [Kofleriaceae bacterium]